jgi:hypothetical protein
LWRVGDPPKPAASLWQVSTRDGRAVQVRSAVAYRAEPRASHASSTADPASRDQARVRVSTPRTRPRVGRSARASDRSTPTSKSHSPACVQGEARVQVGRPVATGLSRPARIPGTRRMIPTPGYRSNRPPEPIKAQHQSRDQRRPSSSMNRVWRRSTAVSIPPVVPLDFRRVFVSVPSLRRRVAGGRRISASI